MAKGRVSFHTDRCKACGICIEFCNKEILGLDNNTINMLGYHPVTVLEPEVCNGCGICALMCPDLVITVERE